MPFLTSTLNAPSLGDCQQRLKKDSLAHEVDTLPARHQTVLPRILRGLQTPPLAFVKTLRNIADHCFLDKNLFEYEVYFG